MTADRVPGGVAQRERQPVPHHGRRNHRGESLSGAGDLLGRADAGHIRLAEGERDLRLPGAWETRLSSIYLAPDLIPQGRIGSRYSLDVGVRKRVQGRRGELVANATDLLNTVPVRRTITGTNFRLESTDGPVHRTVCPTPPHDGDRYHTGD